MRRNSIVVVDVDVEEILQVLVFDVEKTSILGDDLGIRGADLFMESVQVVLLENFAYTMTSIICRVV